MGRGGLEIRVAEFKGQLVAIAWPFSLGRVGRALFTLATLTD
jgi:hypothetical protein